MRSLPTPGPLTWGCHVHLSGGVSRHSPGQPLRAVGLPTDCRWNNESHRPQVRELEKQLGQTQSRSVGAASDELSVCPDPRKLTAQERNLLRIRILEREKQEGWEVMYTCQGGCQSAGHVAPEILTPWQGLRDTPERQETPGGLGHLCACSSHPVDPA